jgi:hypothetical protein
MGWLSIQRSKRVLEPEKRVISLKQPFGGVECGFLPVSCNLPVKPVVIVVVSSLSGFWKRYKQTLPF